MSRSVKIYYGLSGTFKGTTIDCSLKSGDTVLNSGIKQWKYWENSLLGGLNNPSDLNYALLHLSRLKDMKFDLTKDSTTLHVERGVSDMLFYWLLSNPTYENSETLIRNLIEEEISVSMVAGGDISEPTKILLVQKDYEFVRDVVLSEPTRKERFLGGVDDYMLSQDHYIEFTKKFNKISEIIEITNARDYLRSLGLEWKDPKQLNELKN